MKFSHSILLGIVTIHLFLGIACYSTENCVQASPAGPKAPQDASVISIIPAPVRMEMRGGVVSPEAPDSDSIFQLTPETKIVANEKTKELANQLQKMLSPATGYPLKILDNAPDNAIYLKLDPSLKNLGSEGYKLSTDGASARITAADKPGLFYGMQTLRQLLPAAIFKSEPVQGVQWLVPSVTIEDAPRFQWRGMHLDACRHFMPKEFVKKYIDLLAIHKMNQFHWHLTDDQGWRVESKKYPKLTEVGAWRKETVIGKNSGKYDGTPHGGFYTQDDIREIVAYAKQRFITVVPEIEMPGHSMAALAAYPELSCTGGPFEVRTKWGVEGEVYCAGNDKVIQFQKDVLTEVLALFPSEYIHIGGDECPKGRWKTCPKCQARIKAEGLHDEHELQSWFIKQIDSFLVEKGRRLVGWDEILEGGLAPGATVMSWRGQKGGIAAAQAGHDVVMAPNSHTYFDHYQGNKKTEPLAIGGFLPLEKVYSYDPIPAVLTAEQAKHILGVQAQLWSEYIPTVSHAEYMAYPRGSALAEAAWSPVANKDFEAFYARLETHLKRLEHLSVNYRPLDPLRTVAGSWKSGQTSEEFKTMSWDVTSSLKTPGDYWIIFEYTGGRHRLDIEWVELRQGEKTLSRDEHLGITGSSTAHNAYKVSVPAAEGKMTLCASVRSDGGTDSNGTIYCVKTK